MTRNLTTRRGDEMSGDNYPLDRSWGKRPASLPVPARSRRWPVRRFELELFLSAHTRTHGQRDGAEQGLKPNKTTARKEVRDEQAEPKASG